jgi:hypothetical protein
MGLHESTPFKKPVLPLFSTVHLGHHRPAGPGARQNDSQRPNQQFESGEAIPDRECQLTLSVSGHGSGHSGLWIGELTLDTVYSTLAPALSSSAATA